MELAGNEAIEASPEAVLWLAENGSEEVRRALEANGNPDDKKIVR